ncbi:MAG: heavy-metal-associated domain-containing protein [Burkholderiales bacterium]|nr:heavy-metal-associated domain-containing protein [Burkholderiales bacterium]
METVTIGISGMTCTGCVNSVRRVLQAITGVRAAEVTLQPAQAKIEYDPALAGITQFKTAIEDAGYEVA